jgi:hypothetical protein
MLLLWGLGHGGFLLSLTLVVALGWTGLLGVSVVLGLSVTLFHLLQLLAGRSSGGGLCNWCLSLLLVELLLTSLTTFVLAAILFRAAMAPTRNFSSLLGHMGTVVLGIVILGVFCAVCLVLLF